jgi:hypothetical protein
MRSVAPSVMAREQLQQLLAGGADREFERPGSRRARESPHSPCQPLGTGEPTSTPFTARKSTQPEQAPGGWRGWLGMSVPTKSIGSCPRAESDRTIIWRRKGGRCMGRRPRAKLVEARRSATPVILR